MSGITTTGLEKRFGPVRALRDLELSIPTGSLTLAAGPNGAGKSTLLRILAGLTRPTLGEIRILGADPFGAEAPALRSRIGFVGQHASLYGDLTVVENLRFCARLLGLPSARIEEVIADLALEEMAERRLITLSLGYRRRAGLARALLSQPEVLLLDEPWNGLDTEASGRLVKLLVRCRNEGATLLIAAHGAERERELFDYVLRLEGGRLTAFEATRTERA